MTTTEPTPEAVEALAIQRPRATNKAKAMTRPQDWAPAARAYLFGMSTLNDDERARELHRRAAYPDRYPRAKTR